MVILALFANFVPNEHKTAQKVGTYIFLTRFRRTSEVDLIPGPEQSFDIVGGYFSADLKPFLSHSLNMHFPITQSSMAFLKIKVMLLSLALDQLKKLEWRHCGGERKIAREILNPLTLGGNRTLRGGQGFLFRRGRGREMNRAEG
jgi:hypothetical protein